MWVDNKFKEIAREFIDMPVNIDLGLLLQIKLYADSKGQPTWQVLQEDLAKLYPKDDSVNMFGNTFAYLPEGVQEQMRVANIKAVQLYKQAMKQSPGEAEKTIKKGQRILQDAVDLMKQIDGEPTAKEKETEQMLKSRYSK